MIARYYAGAKGRFLSQDPAYLDSGIGGEAFKKKYQKDFDEHLSNPQGLNSYSYANNNPMKYVDVTGELAIPAFLKQTARDTGTFTLGVLATGAFSLTTVGKASIDSANFLTLGLVPGLDKAINLLGKVQTASAKANVKGVALVLDTSVSIEEANEIAKQVSNIGDIALFLLTPQKGLPKLVKNPTGTLKKVTVTAQKVKNTKAFKELKFV